MHSYNFIQQVSSHPGIWTLLFLIIASLGIYYSLILVIRDRGRGRQRSMLGLYAICSSILLLHLLAHPYWNNPGQDWIQIAGIVSLFLMGPSSYRMIIDQTQPWGISINLIPFIPAFVISGIMIIGLIQESLSYTLGIIYTGLFLIAQALSLNLRSISPSALNWNKWYTGVQLTFFVGTIISILVLPAQLFCILASAGLACLILLNWIRLLYMAYLSYVISRS
jgi:hypothetical protein